MDTDKYVSALRQIQTLVNDALRQSPAALPGKPALAPKPIALNDPLAFDMNILAFMNKYARNSNGQQKFTLLVAYLAKGNTDVEVSTLDVRTQWNNMKTVLGGSFNPVSSNRAKSGGWVEPGKKGVWKLSGSWKDALTA
jgi:hypothetical protein